MDCYAASEELRERSVCGGWVSVKDRLPNHGQFVLAYGDACQGWTDGPKIAVFRWYSAAWWDANMDAEFAGADPTHWMPLPEPPAC